MKLPEPYYSRVLHLCRELQSGRWFQIDSQLREDAPIYIGPGPEDIVNVGFCCLGVACELALVEGVGYRVGEKYWNSAEAIAVFPEGNGTDLPGAVMDWYGFDDSNPEITILCHEISESRPGSWCDDCQSWDGEARNECTNTINVPASEANDDLGLNFSQIAQGFARRWLGGVEALDATPTR